MMVKKITVTAGIDWVNRTGEMGKIKKCTPYIGTSINI